MPAPVRVRVGTRGLFNEGRCRNSCQGSPTPTQLSGVGSGVWTPEERSLLQAAPLGFSRHRTPSPPLLVQSLPSPRPLQQARLRFVHFGAIATLLACLLISLRSPGPGRSRAHVAAWSRPPWLSSPWSASRCSRKSAQMAGPLNQRTSLVCCCLGRTRRPAITTAA